MRDQIRKIIDGVTRPTENWGLEECQPAELRLAAETIRLARLAASTHMILAARQMASQPADPPGPAGGVR